MQCVRWMSRLFPAGVIFLAFWTTALYAAGEPGMTIAQQGQARVSLVIGKKCSLPTRFAAEELQRTIRHMSGARCPIVNDDQPAATPCIALGSPRQNRVSAELLRRAGVDFDSLDLGDDGFLLRLVGKDLVAAGRVPRAALYAAYAILEQLGCRWCFPGPHGEVVPERSTLVLPPLALVEKPALSYRTFLQLEVVGPATVDWIDWMAKNRMNCFVVTLYPAKGYKGQLYSQFKSTPGLLEGIQKRGLLIEAGNHASYYWIPPADYFPRRPDFFAQINGIRGPLEALSHDRGQLCFSNADVAAETARRLIAFAGHNPEADIFSIYTNDGYGYCECSACRALGSPSDAYCTYVNRVGEIVGRELPGKRLSFLSYSTVKDPPRVRVTAGNTLCAIATWPPPDEDRLKGWLASGASQVALYEYYMGSYSDRSFPWMNARTIAEELKTLHRHGAAGVASQCELENWTAYALNYWAFARLSWNPSIPVEAVLGDYLTNHYAGAAEPMRAYFECLETVGRVPRDVSLPEGKLRQLDQLLSVAEKAAATPVITARIHRDRIALDYLLLAWKLEETRRQATALRDQGNSDEAIETLRRAETTAAACLEHLHRHRGQRVFLAGRSDQPQEIVGHYYTTAYYERSLTAVQKGLARLLAVRERSNHRNLAVGKKALAQSEYSRAYTADRAVDGDPVTAWYSGYHRSDPKTELHRLPQWLQVDLGRATAIAATVVKTAVQRYHYCIDVSNDEQQWVRVVDKKDDSKGTTLPGALHTFPAVEARYVRITFTDNDKSAGHLHEIEVYASVDDVPSTPSAGQSPGKSPAAARPSSPTKVRTAEKAAPASNEVRDAFYADLRRLAAESPEDRITDAFPGTTREWLAHSRRLRQQLRTVFHFPAVDVPLDARTVGVLDRGDFAIEKLIYRAEADNCVTANLYLPKGLAGPLPAMILASGHGGSKSAPYNQYFAQMYAKAGCAVLVPDPIGEEERDERGRLAIRGHRQEYRIDRCQALGISTIGKMVYDIVRGVDYLASRPEVDRRRIGCAGHSLGGTVTEYATAVDPRISLSMPTAWTCHFAEIVGEPSCCWRPVGLLRVAGDPELFALGAPHCATLVLAGGDDACPMHVNRFEESTVPPAKRVYQLFGREDCLAVHVTPQAGHQPFQLNRAALAWVHKHFHPPRLSADAIAALDEGPPDDILAELTVPFENKSWNPGRLAAAKAARCNVRLMPFDTLRCLEPGREAGPEFGMASWVAARQAQLAARFEVPKSAEQLDQRCGPLRPRLLELLNLPARGDPAQVKTLRTYPRTTTAKSSGEKVSGTEGVLAPAPSRLDRDSVQVCELKYGRLGLSSLLATPQGVAHPPVAIYLHRSRTRQGGLESPRTDELLAAGTAVLAIDCVPFEETTYLLGTSPTAYNVSRVLESLDVLERIGDLDLTQIACIGEVDDVALLAALVDDRITSVTVAGASGSRVPKLSYRLEGVVPGLQAIADRTELLALLAPRKLRIEIDEPGRKQIEQTYALKGAAERLQFVSPSRPTAARP